MYLSNDPRRPIWKVVCRTDVRDKRGPNEVNQSLPNVIGEGNDGDFVCLQPRVEDAEPIKEPATEGKVYIPQRVHDRRPNPHEET